jgi:cyclopropane-fatty-acyl-phospholipid synthase
MEDWQNIGINYDKTLMAWHHNFNQHWDELKPQYDERFRRMWNYFLLSCAGSFRARHNQVWQVLLSKNGLKNGFIR